jgi:hypothetical protein
VRVRTVTVLLALLWGMCFAFGAYGIYSAWVEHRGPHGTGATPTLGLPALPAEPPLTRRPQIRLGT